ncbi:MAG: DUF2778 domain-containing protein, partial [Nitrospirae bacterium]|nr:DUF2778 domain-containing protein [Nitrospirota bacterium]
IAINGFNADCTPLTASFKYDALGRRIEKTVNGKTTQYLYGGLDIVQEIEDGMVTVNYIRTLNIDEPLVRIKSDGTIRYYQQDALGSVIALTDENGTVKTTYSYDPYGNTEVMGEPSDNPFQYTGRENDGGGHYYYRTRYKLDSRFISEDPIGMAGGMNYYSYVRNAPINYRDPLGLHTIGFNGTGLLVVDDDGNPVAYYPATSGLPDYSNPRYQFLKNKGPIPAGSYYLNPSEFSGGRLRSLYWRFVRFEDWGRWRVPLHTKPKTNTYGRSGFFIHGGMFSGSKGCIDIGKHDIEFYNLLKEHEGPVDVIIFYPSLFIIPISKLRKRRFWYFIGNGFLLGIFLSTIRQVYIFISNWNWTPPEHWFVGYIKGLLILLFLVLLYILPLHFYRKNKTSVTKQEFIFSWEVAWVVFSIYETILSFFIYTGLRPVTLDLVLSQIHEDSLFFAKWFILGRLFLQELLWGIFIGNLVSFIIFGFLLYLQKLFWQVRRNT